MEEIRVVVTQHNGIHNFNAKELRERILKVQEACVNDKKEKMNVGDIVIDSKGRKYEFIEQVNRVWIVEESKNESVSVLGTDYSVEYSNEKKDKGLVGLNGYCDFSIKTCVIDDFKDDGTGKCFANLSAQQNKTVRHELIHAFLYESGLDLNSIGKWAANEEMVDWFAINSPKIFKAFEELGIL